MSESFLLRHFFWCITSRWQWIISVLLWAELSPFPISRWFHHGVWENAGEFSLFIMKFEALQFMRNLWMNKKAFQRGGKKVVLIVPKGCLPTEIEIIEINEILSEQSKPFQLTLILRLSTFFPSSCAQWSVREEMKFPSQASEMAEKINCGDWSW